MGETRGWGRGGGLQVQNQNHINSRSFACLLLGKHRDENPCWTILKNIAEVIRIPNHVVN